mmetsp:Transcript_107844/g.336337  ORF Transcript_107844/g.336337 Transcript_107844/m.336337 type:complete len:552 (+) Transcript_107844:310-1965(+)
MAVVQLLVREVLDPRGGFEGLVPRVHGHHDVVDQTHRRPLEDPLRRQRVGRLQHLGQQLPGLLGSSRSGSPPLGAHTADPPGGAQVYLYVLGVGVLRGAPTAVAVRRCADAVEQSSARRSLGVCAGGQGAIRHLPAADSQGSRPSRQGLLPEVVRSGRARGAPDLQLDLLVDLRDVRAQLPGLPHQVVQAVHKLPEPSVELAYLAPGLELVHLELSADERHREDELLADLLFALVPLLLLVVLPGFGRLRLLGRGALLLGTSDDPAHVGQQRGQGVLKFALERVQVVQLSEHGRGLPIGLLQQHPARGTDIVVDLGLLAPAGDIVHHGVLAQGHSAALGGDSLLFRQDLREVGVPVRRRNSPGATGVACAQRLQLLHGQLHVALLLQELQTTIPFCIRLLDVLRVLLLECLALLLVLPRGILLVLPGLLHELFHLIDLDLVPAGVGNARGLLGQLRLQQLDLLLELGDVLGFLVLRGIDLDGLRTLGVVEGGERLVGVYLGRREGCHHRGERIAAQGLLKHAGELGVPVRNEHLLVAPRHQAERVDDVPQS